MSSQNVAIVREGVADHLVYVAQVRALSLNEVSAEAGNVLSLCEYAESCEPNAASEEMLRRLWVVLAWVRRESANYAQALDLRHLIGVRIGLGELA